MLASYLDFHRDTLAMKCDGLSDEQLRNRAVSPSTLSLLGLVRHMAEVERGWIQNRLQGADRPYIYCSEDEDPDGDFDNIDDADVAEAFDTWREQCAISRRAVTDAESLDVIVKNAPRGRHVSLRWIMLHLIEEYARHNGHADLLRERIDGATGD